MSEMLPYELPPVDPGDTLTVLVGGGGDEPERLLRIGRPQDGLVRVLEWTSENWSAPFERELSAEALLQALEQAAAHRRRLSEELGRIRRWLREGV
ncbi:MAG TPA: hypothetical protein VFS08_16325 [Gemmatimonadaceae bacterium]|nr:hypothetical protein [Gemmatimonadaceae bacterium]